MQRRTPDTPTDKSSLSEWQHAERILAIRLDSMGDVLMTSPAFRALTAAGKSVTLLTSPAGAAIAREIPEIDDVIAYEAPWMPTSMQEKEARVRLQSLIDELGERRFDAAVIFTVFTQNPAAAAMLAFQAGIPLRAAHCRENIYGLLTYSVKDPDLLDEESRAVPVDRVRHEVRRQLDLVAALGFCTDDPASERLSLRVRAEAQDSLYAKLERLGFAGDDSLLTTDRAWAVVHTGANAASRRYHPRHFRDVVQQLRSIGWNIVLTGSREEHSTTSYIADSTGAVDLAGRLDLPELVALIARAPLLISNNSGPVHIAAAVGTPVIDIYALTNPQHTPWHVPHRVLSHDVSCKNCFKSVCPMGHQDCIDKVAPNDVVIAAQQLLHDTRKSRSLLPLLQRTDSSLLSTTV